ncbi:hypothetical protein S7711_10062 [Stachybotrys chartarum IBT 7711]|uniref:protein-ribulosamine 3-kinase n=1 Tax=Stachybotrys chartarum (strain CBS 109288 / IBT 7711) TaxID=1280523 RepID=A0A084B2Q3_STACB|nr:hypothetical protein S7711_10062 [Stachybotrys chartarum IBT 7711]KFA45453.1 hypothetical protein S40293_10154 [Stachybotrys chartarum IBT 40293]
MLDELLDPAIIAALPAGGQIIEVAEHGTSSWSSGHRILVELDGEEKEYFLKVGLYGTCVSASADDSYVKLIYRPRHAEMALGEYESQKAMWEHIPDNVVVPLAHGTLQLDDSKSFFLTTFRDFKSKDPSPEELISLLKELHTRAISPTGKFGFHVTTFNGYVPLVNDWCDSWEEYFSRQFRSDIEWEQGIRGPDREFNNVVDEFFQKVIPRLLRPLQTGGRSIKPVLVHGDIWHGNVKIDSASQKVILFDSCCCYAHNELELHMMREPRYRFTREHAQLYKKAVDPSEPMEDFDDRNALYAMRDNIINSGLHEHRAYLRQQ